jgi:hypothetical protein
VPCHRLPVVSPDARSMKRPASRRPIPPQRRRSVPISNEHHLAEPDTLGTTIKLSFLDWRGPLAWRQRTTTSGAGTVTSIYGVGRRDVPGDPLAPGFWFRDRLLVIAASRGLGGRLRNVSVAGVSQR